MLVRKKLSRRNENESADLIKLSKKRSGKAAGFTVAYVEWIMQESSNCLWVERRGTTRVSQRRVDNKDNNDFEKHQSVLFSPLEHLTLIKKIGHKDDTIWVAALFKKSQCTTEQYFRTWVTVKKDTVDSTCVASVTLTYSVLVACFFFMSWQWQLHQQDCIILTMSACIHQRGAERWEQQAVAKKSTKALLVSLSRFYMFIPNKRIWIQCERIRLHFSTLS